MSRLTSPIGCSAWATSERWSSLPLSDRCDAAGPPTAGPLDAGTATVVVVVEGTAVAVSAGTVVEVVGGTVVVVVAGVAGVVVTVVATGVDGSVVGVVGVAGSVVGGVVGGG